MDEQQVKEALQQRRTRNNHRTLLKRIIGRRDVNAFVDFNCSVDLLADVVESMDADTIARFMVQLGNAVEDEQSVAYDSGYADGLEDCRE